MSETLRNLQLPSLLEVLAVRYERAIEKIEVGDYVLVQVLHNYRNISAAGVIATLQICLGLFSKQAEMSATDKRYFLELLLILGKQPDPIISITQLNRLRTIASEVPYLPHQL